MNDQTREIHNPGVPDGLSDADSKPRRDDEKGDRPVIELGNRDRGPAKSFENHSAKRG